MTLALRLYPSLVSAKKYTDEVMTDVLQSAWKRFFERDGQENDIACAADLLVRREAQIARKQDRAVMQNSVVIRDELFGFYLAGHETTSTTVCWAVKHLTEHQEVHQKLRSSLRSTFRVAAQEDRLPTAREMTENIVPYLDAFIEENHRLGNAIPTTIRRTTRNALVLGHMIPKGTDVFMISNGPGFRSLALPVDESKRSRTSQDSKSRYGIWDDTHISDFKPERFLVENEIGEIRFDPHAGPVMAYGAGLRACFGKYSDLMAVNVKRLTARQ
jgi:cytochrome P450